MATTTEDLVTGNSQENGEWNEFLNAFGVEPAAVVETEHGEEVHGVETEHHEENEHSAHTEYSADDHHEEGIHVSLTPDVIGTVGPLQITNSLISSVLGSVILLVLMLLLVKKIKIIPGRAQSLLEMIVDKGYAFTEEILEDSAVARKTFPLVASLFIFILFFNLIKFIPGYESLKFNGLHFFKPIHSDLNMTLALGITAFIFIQAVGIFVLGTFKYGSKFINFKKPLSIPLGLIELISEIAKMFSLSFRLFGNIFAGGILIVLAGSVTHWLLPVPVMFFEIFVALLQASIFSLLTVVYVKLAISEPH